jgi:hypothetical protein
VKKFSPFDEICHVSYTVYVSRTLDTGVEMNHEVIEPALWTLNGTLWTGGVVRGTVFGHVPSGIVLSVANPTKFDNCRIKI